MPEASGPLTPPTPARSTQRLLVRPTVQAGWVWMLMAGNGRPLGRGAPPRVDAPAAVSDFRAAVAASASMGTSVRHRAAGRGWVWELVDIGGTARAQSAYHYERHGTCERAALRFLDRLRTLADVETLVSTVTVERSGRPQDRHAR